MNIEVWHRKESPGVMQSQIGLSLCSLMGSFLLSAHYATATQIMSVPSSNHHGFLSSSPNAQSFYHGLQALRDPSWPFSGPPLSPASPELPALPCFSGASKLIPVSGLSPLQCPLPGAPFTQILLFMAHLKYLPLACLHPSTHCCTCLYPVCFLYGTQHTLQYFFIHC